MTINSPNDRLRKARQARGWSEQDLADELQQWEYDRGTGRDLPIERNYVYRWESGRRGVSDFYALRLEHVFSLSREQLGLVDRRARNHPIGATLDATPDEGGSIVQRRAFNHLVVAGGVATAGLVAEKMAAGRPESLAPGTPVSIPIHVQRIRDRLIRYDSIDGIPRGEPANLRTLQRNVTNAWRVFQRSDYSTLASRVPDLIDTATLASRDLQDTARSRATELLSEALQLAAILLLKQGDSNLAWVAADRAMLTAERTDNHLTIAGAARILAYALLGAGHYDKAKDLCLGAATRLEREPDFASPQALSAYGALLLKAGIAAAMQDDRAAANEVLTQAGKIADRLGRDANYMWTAFGPTNVIVHRVSAAIELGDAGAAIDHAGNIDPSDLPVLERRAHHLIDIARAHGQRSKNEQALSSLLTAEQLAPEEVRVSPQVQVLVSELLHRNTQHAPQLRALANRVQAAT